VPEVGEDRAGSWCAAPSARPRTVGDSALVDEDRRLRVADDQGRALLDLEVGRREAPGEHVVTLFRPVDDVDELLVDEARESHGTLRSTVEVAKRVTPSKADATCRRRTARVSSRRSVSSRAAEERSAAITVNDASLAMPAQRRGVMP
jgi:hypothetical protein